MGAGALAMAALFVGWITYGWGGETVTLWFTDLASLAVPAATGATCLLRARRETGHLRQAWVMAGLACLSWAAGQAVWSWIELVQHELSPTPSWADAGYLGFIPFMAASLVMAMTGAAASASRMRALLDGAIVAASIFFISWTTTFAQAFQGGVGSLLGRTINASYPLGDTVLVLLAVYAVTRAPAGSRRPSVYQLAGIFAITVADMGFLLATLAGSYLTGSLIDAGWLMGFQLIGLSAVVPGRQKAGGLPRPTIWGTAASFLPFGAAMATAATVQVIRGALEPVLFWTAFVAIALVLARVFVSLWENLGLTRGIEAAYARLQETERQRSAAVRTVTHDLQNPLSPIQIQLKLLSASQDPATERQRRALSIIGRNTAQIARLVADFADLAKIQDARLRLDVRDMDLAGAVHAAGEGFSEQARERGVAFAVEGTEGLPVRADAGRILQVVQNYLGNALKFTPKGGAITLSVRRDGEAAVAEVRDTGRGLTPDEMARLFKPFSQVHAPGEIPERGTGLGLFICKGLVEAQAGTVGVRSEGKGKGSTFWFRLPLADGARPASPPAGP